VRVIDHIRKHLLAEIFTTSVGHANESQESLLITEWSPVFEKLMRKRLLCGRHRYGKMNDPAKGEYDCIGSAIDRLRRYQITGNLEHLVDVANLMLVEFEHSNHPNRHFDATDDAIHCEAVFKT
jgi:hypothetical protein